MARNKYDLTVNVMMVGGRRCGKTSVLAAMQNCFEAQCTNTPLVIGAADLDLLNIIEAKNDEINRYFIRGGKERGFVPDDTPTEELMQYPFYVGIKGKSNRIRINFIDYPGEWLNGKEHWDVLEQCMSQSRILLIAIDTPHLMEEEGLYNDAKNKCMRITQMVKDIDFASPAKGAGMILFVPLKCERYYNHNEINDVTDNIRKVYKPLIDYLHQPESDQIRRSWITIAITPIMTMGLETAEFSHFERDENYDIKTVGGIPTCARYIFMDNCKNSPDPKYCEQPLLYVLAYVLDMTSRVKSAYRFKFAHHILNFLQSSLLKWPSAEDYQGQSSAIKNKLKLRGDGYYIVDKGILQVK